jgi:hypothetical protein
MQMFDQISRGHAGAVDDPRSIRAAATAGIIAFCGLLATACAPLSGYPEEVADPEVEVTSLEPYFNPEVMKTYAAKTDPVQREQYRNEVIYGRLRALDIRFNQFTKAISEDHSLYSIGADWIVLALNAAGATTGGAAAKSALAAASAGIVGAKGSVDKNLYYEKTLPVIVATMEARRLTAQVPIVRGLQSSDADYSLYEALVDLGAYETAGSIPGAINGLVKAAGEEAAVAQREIKFVRSTKFVDRLEAVIPIRDRVKALTDQQALALATEMEPRLAERPENLQQALNERDPNKRHLTSGSAARAFLMQWVIQDERDDELLKQWTDALDKIGG